MKERLLIWPGDRLRLRLAGNEEKDECYISIPPQLYRATAQWEIVGPPLLGSWEEADVVRCLAGGYFKEGF